ncbi:hypothetical protein FisN_4Lh568 [Fistulifera solaris]|uniref:PABS domain-containing protein n=1 Tax=Fistulifera solaris TaxID=1519565 RepID=A0A1Z5KEC7_FISSO|nr:hypothetical protein FisN_4Lh568 [Fistulifera solaris]|eukprot:GAX24431.1 hypothetical protein FisN_4Lh568 [Fistulifera solaris]
MATADDQRRLYRVDIRVFLVAITCAMAASFILGVSLAPVPILDDNMRSTLIYSSPSSPSVRDEFFKISEEDIASVEEKHLPAGQHLLVDIEYVDEDFLNSEERLSKAMVDTVKESGLHMLSYHCHALVPSGVSCVGVLLESHISFHTWPAEGVITLDLFTCGSKPLLPAVETIERLFGIPNTKNPDQKIHTQWSHELRGFRPEEEVKKNYLADSSDLSLWVLSPLEMYSKKRVYSGRTKFQQVDIWDLVELVDTPSYEDVIKYNMTPGDTRLNSPEYSTPDRLLFLDGTIQSVYSSEHVYHEALVHPAMFAHPNPKNVVILGGGEGATLREVLKHKTVEAAIMLEIDEELIPIVREHLASMSDCSDLFGRADNCFDDKLADLKFTDGRQWFVDQYGASSSVVPQYKELDIIILDALDPEDGSEISNQLYSDESFVDALINSLSEEGILVIQIGTAASIDDPRPDFGLYKQREFLFKLIEANPTIEAMFVYEEAHCGFMEPHAFLIACKSANCRSRWYARSDQVDFQIYERIVRTHSKKRALTFYDGTTQRSYQWPKKGWETVYCRREPMPFECAYRTMDRNSGLFELDLDDEKQSSLRVSIETDEKGEAVSKLFATVDIPKGSFILSEDMASSLMINSRNFEGLKGNVEAGGDNVSVISDLLAFFEEYAHESGASGSNQHYVEVGGSVFVRRSENEGDVNIVRWLPPHPEGKRPKFSPVYERHRMSFDLFLVASKDINAGDEIVMSHKTWVN